MQDVNASPAGDFIMIDADSFRAQAGVDEGKGEA
jgi:hypothetical protein